MSFESTAVRGSLKLQRSALAIALVASAGAIAQTAPAGTSRPAAYDCSGQSGPALTACVQLNAQAAQAATIGTGSPGGSHDCSSLTGAALATCMDLNGKPVPPALINGGADGARAGYAGYSAYGAGGSVPGSTYPNVISPDLSSPSVGTGIGTPSGSAGSPGSTGTTPAHSDIGGSSAGSVTGNEVIPSTQPSSTPIGSDTSRSTQPSSTPMGGEQVRGNDPNRVPRPNDRIVPLGPSSQSAPATPSTAAPVGVPGSSGGVPTGR